MSGAPAHKVAVVTGGASGIGLGVGRRLARDGMTVALLDRDGTAAMAGAEGVVAEGGRAIGLECDVTDRSAVESAYEIVRSELGPITVVVTSAGIESFDKITEIDPEVWDRVIAVNLTGTFTCLQLAIPDMVQAQWGRMVTISSASAQSGAKRMAHYVASKGGVISLTKAFAQELAKHHITVNTIPPALVDTPMARQAEGVGDVPPVEQIAKAIPLGRAGTPDDIAGACSFLCSDDAEYVTGQVVGVNGGLYL